MEWELLRGLKEEEVEQVLAAGRRRRFARREVVWHEGDRAEVVLLIRSGRMAIRAMTSLGDEATVAVVGSGQAAGLVAVYATDPHYTTTTVALEATEAVAIRVDDMSAIRRRLPIVDDNVVRFLADRTIDLSIQLVDALFVPADARVLKRLVALSGVYDRGVGEILIPLTQEDLAGLAGVTRPTVNRVLKEEERRGTVRLSRGSITVTDLERVAGRAE
jgi:CRP/FNR family cyclic AMP-dependent transcriptional regulator